MKTPTGGLFNGAPLPHFDAPQNFWDGNQFVIPGLADIKAPNPIYGAPLEPYRPGPPLPTGNMEPGGREGVSADSRGDIFGNASPAMTGGGLNHAGGARRLNQTLALRAPRQWNPPSLFGNGYQFGANSSLLPSGSGDDDSDKYESLWV